MIKEIVLHLSGYYTFRDTIWHSYDFGFYTSDENSPSVYRLLDYKLTYKPRYRVSNYILLQTVTPLSLLLRILYFFRKKRNKISCKIRYQDFSEKT